MESFLNVSHVEFEQVNIYWVADPITELLKSHYVF